MVDDEGAEAAPAAEESVDLDLAYEAADGSDALAQGRADIEAMLLG